MRTLLLILLFPLLANSKQIKIAVIDTGIVTKDLKLSICKNGLIDFTGTGINDTHGHGTNIAHIIASHLNHKDYCLYILKAFVGMNANRSYSIEALVKASTLDINLINYSAGGEGKISLEEKTIGILESKGIVLIAAAGNDDKDLSENCYYFPACYKNSNVFVVGSIANDKTKSKSSNYGPGIISFWWYGEQQDFGGFKFTGTSQATAHVTGIVAKGMK